MKKTHQIIPLISTAVLASALTTEAANFLWTGATDTDYSTGSNWDTGTVPNLALPGNKAFVGGTAIYDAAGGDFTVNNLSRLTVTTGGSFTQTNGVAWMNFIGGNLIVQAGSSFSTGTSQNLLRDANTVISVNGTFDYGSAADFSTPNFNTAAANGTFTVGSGATVNIAGELNLGSDFTFNPGVTYTGGNVITALNSTEFLTIDGANLSIVDNGASQAGFFGFDGINNYVDFTSNGGTITLSNVDGATEVSDAINNGKIRYNGATDPTNITFTDLGGGSYEIVAVPEPASFGLLAGSLALGATALRRRRS